mgnify:CR=1 FL=1
MPRIPAATIVLKLVLATAAGLADQVSDEIIARIQAAAPEQPCVKPAKPRKLLIFTLCRGFRHDVIPIGSEALKILGRKTGAFEAVVSQDIAVFEPASLAQFDAVCLQNTTGELFLPPDFDQLPPEEQAAAKKRDERLKQSLLDFVSAGRGLVGVHAATDCFYQWPEYGRLIGAYFDGHPWNEKVVLKVDDPEHPIVAMFAGQPFEVADEIYQFREPYSRDRLRVLLSLDAERTDLTKPGIRRQDKDFAVSWVRRYGAGRVFYCSLGHRDEIFWSPQILRHYLAGIQFALGDLSADATASGGSGPEAWLRLIDDGKLSEWQAVVGDPKTLAESKPADWAKAQAEADRAMRAHWTVSDGVLAFDGQGPSIRTVREFGDFELKLEWKIESGGDSGVYLRGCPQVQIWDAQQHPEGSGGLYNNQHNPSKPHIRMDKPIGTWNSMRVQMIGSVVNVTLNGQCVAFEVPLENYWDPSQPVPPTGPVELQAHGTPIWFRKIMIRQIPPQEPAAETSEPRWRKLFNGKDLTGWSCKPGSWAVEDGALALKGGGDIWTEEQFGNFLLELEFKLDPGTNSGIFFRTADTSDCVQTGIEMQVLDSFGKPTPDKHDCGAIYDCMAPFVNAVRPPGEWNHVVLLARGGHIWASMNGEFIIGMDLENWTEAGRNPDGTPNKFRTAYKDMPRIGHIGFQDHGKPVWYRNIRIRPLTGRAHWRITPHTVFDSQRADTPVAGLWSNGE